MDLSIIILNFNTKNMLKECLRSLVRASVAVSHEIIVVDNASHDGTAAMLAAEFPQVRCIQSAINKGYAGGNNLGLAQAHGRYQMIMNPDILVDAGSIEGLVAYLDTHPTVGLVGPRLNNPDGSLQYTCYRFPRWWTPLFRRSLFGVLPWAKKHISSYLMEEFDHASAMPVDWLLGGALMARKEAIVDVGPLDEGFFLYFDDTDWCRRFWEKGWQVVSVSTVSMIHFHQRASRGGLLALLRSRAARIHLRSGVRYFWKYFRKPSPHIA